MRRINRISMSRKISKIIMGAVSWLKTEITRIHALNAEAQAVGMVLKQISKAIILALIKSAAIHLMVQI